MKYVRQFYRNVVIALFITSYARLELLNFFHKLNNKVFYYDTDSIIYISVDGNNVIKTSNYLGDLTNELDDDKYIVLFCSTGPKSYSYKANSACERTFFKG